MCGNLLDRHGYLATCLEARQIGNLLRGTATRHGVRCADPMTTAAARVLADVNLLTIIAEQVRIVEMADRSCWDQPGEPAPCVSLRCVSGCEPKPPPKEGVT